MSGCRVVRETCESLGPSETPSMVLRGFKGILAWASFEALRTSQHYGNDRFKGGPLPVPHYADFIFFFTLVWAHEPWFEAPKSIVLIEVYSSRLKCTIVLSIRPHCCIFFKRNKITTNKKKYYFAKKKTKKKLFKNNKNDQQKKYEKKVTLAPERTGIFLHCPPSRDWRLSA